MLSERRQGWIGGILAQLSESLSYETSIDLGLPISIYEIEDIKGVDQALYCISTMRSRTKSKTGEAYRYTIGIVDPNLPAQMSYGSLRKGKIVLYEPQPNGKLTITVPYSEDEIKRQEAKGSLLCGSTIVNVPPKFICPIT